MEHSFKHVNGRIILVIRVKVWGGDVISEHDVTDQVMPVIDDYLDHHLGLTEYKHTNGKLSYTGEDKK